MPFSESRNVEEIVHRLIPGNLENISRIYNCSNNCAVYKLFVNSRAYKLYQVESSYRAKQIKTATDLLLHYRINIPKCYGISDSYVLSEWIEGQKVELSNRKILKKIAIYHAAIHNVSVPTKSKTQEFRHLPWLINRFVDVCSKHVNKDELICIGTKVLNLLPDDLECRISNPDFIPSNLIITNEGKIYIVDNEFLYISTGYEFDIYNLMFGLGESLRNNYLKQYSKVLPLKSYYYYLWYWDLCLSLKRCRKFFF